MAEYRVGDWVVFDVTKPYCRLLPNDLMKIVNPEYESQSMIVGYLNGVLYEIGGKSVRHATNKEIAQGYRDDN
ncbi:MAG: hypothetical protein [Bacteriophage sp.]|nr:MAG: hypothetical protein [Bacteriophage sp.]